MGTRSLTYVYDKEVSDLPFMCMYRHYDGYPSGHGAELAKFLKDTDHNGITCLAASMVAHFKTGAYNIYLYPPDLDQDCWQDYEYHVYNGYVKVTKNRQESLLFHGTWEEFTEFCTTDETEDSVE